MGEDGEEAAVCGAFVVDVFEELVGVLDVGGQVASVAVAFDEGAAGEEDVCAGGVVLDRGDLVADAVEREGVRGGEVVVEGVEIVEPVESIIGVGLAVDYGEGLEEVAESLSVLLQFYERWGRTVGVAEERAVEKVVLVALFSRPLREEVGSICAGECMSGDGFNLLKGDAVGVGPFLSLDCYTLSSCRRLRRFNGGCCSLGICRIWCRHF